MSQLEDLEREEFVQNYLQYRWLDDTRARFVDRYFVVILAVLVARFQLPFLEEHPVWRGVLYFLFTLAAVFMAKSIISFRRQQRGHGEYINAIRSRILSSKADELSEFSDYVKYMTGKPVFLTAWIELLVASTATFSPLVFLDLVFDGAVHLSSVFSVLAISAIGLSMSLNAWLLLVPCWRYNQPALPPWNKM